MYQLRVKTGNHEELYHYPDAWSANLLASAFVRNYSDVTKAEVINLATRKVEQTYVKGE